MKRIEKDERIFVFLKLVIIVPILFFVLTFLIPVRLDRFINSQRVKSIEIRNGNTGDSIMVTDPEDVESILTYVSNCKVSRKVTLPSGGWSYRLQFYDGEECIDDLVFSGDLVDTGFGKHVISKNDNTEILTELIEPLYNKYPCMKGSEN